MQNNRTVLGALTFALLPMLVFSATLNDIPMQGGMVMPMVSYQEADGKMHVMMSSDIPQLTPLLISNPTDNFNPLDPWFEALDPSRNGESFSRRYGFVMDSMTDPLPANTQMWIRRLTNSAGLKFYRHSTSVPKAFAPIFGTDGSTNAMHWNGIMFHPTISAPSGTNAHTATFEVYLLNTTTGQEVPNSHSGTLAFTWSNVPDERPTLSLVSKIVVAWPANTTSNWMLETASAANSSAWATVTNTPVVLEGQPCVILDSTASQQCFRMRHLP